VGDGSRGWTDRRFFERILVTAGTLEAPEELLDQLAPCGFMVVPLGPRDNQRVTLITRSNRGLQYQSLLPVRFVPLVRENCP
jgi:protein-L-isoaspartate(D-aspartate) O-methyltransferase